MNQQEIAMPPPRKWTRTEELAVLHLYRGKVLPESREALALAEALERTPRSIAARMLGLASLDPANPKTPAAKATALTRSLWAEYMSDRTAIASEGQRAYLGILNRYAMGRP